MCKELIDLKRVPSHVAIIMDGNGRWAKKQGEERSFGHQVGAETVKIIAEEASRLGVQFLTLYAFSTENWSRPAEEVSGLMHLLMVSLEEEIFMKNNIRFRLIGDIEKLPKELCNQVYACVEHTSKNSGMCFVLALSYSSRWEIVEATKKITNQVQTGELMLDQITEKTVSEALETHFMPNPDLLIRTGGECRLSNFLMWQCAYSELYFTESYWPEFREDAFYKAIYDYQQRERRFGKTSEQIQ